MSPQLDISEIFTDDDLANVQLIVIRTTRTVSNEGLNIESSVTLCAGPSAVYPSSDQEISILSDEERVGAFITAVSPFRFVPLTVSNSPDIVVWENSHYRVMRTTDYRQYGAGFVQAVCQLITFTLDDSVLTT